ncbi:MAG: EFR1 family ferrodoxin, partial [Spirochaetota bacterium]
TGIYYFTGTGNTLALARDLAAELGGAELIPVKKSVNASSVQSKHDTVILAYPVYCFGAPVIIRKFITKLKTKKGAKIYLCASYGGMLSDSLAAFRDYAASAGVTISAGYAVRMPGNYQIMYDVYSADKQAGFFTKEKIRVREIAAAIQRGDEGNFDRNLGILGLFLSRVVNKGAVKHMGEADGKFILTDACSGCGTCAKLCPVKNITMKNKRPQWNHACEQCLACMQWCPEKAIVQGKSAKHGQYHHPSVKMKDIL